MTVATPGVTWPSVAESFDRSLAELGYVTFLYGGGYAASSFMSGGLTARKGTGSILRGAAATVTLALAGVSASPSWLMFLLATAVLGFGGGLVDAATNTFVAIRRGARAMGSIHGVFGIGAIAGPLFVTALLQAGFSWRIAYALLALGQGLYVAGLLLLARGSDADAPTDSNSHGGGGLMRDRVVLWSLVVFFVYAGIAVGAGAWAFTYLTEERGASDALGGLIVGGYWASFALSRLLLGAVGERIRPDSSLRWSAAFTTLALIVLWGSDAVWLGGTALVLAGFAHGPVFPLEMLLTPRRVGLASTAKVIGFEVAAMNVGGAVLPALMGVAVGAVGLSVIPPLLVLNALTLLACVEILRRRSHAPLPGEMRSASN